MILLAGIPSEPPLALAAAALRGLGVPFLWFDQRHALQARLRLAIESGVPGGELSHNGKAVALESLSAAYVRTMDDRFLPEVEPLPHDAAERRHVRALHDRLYTWLELTEALVVNRASAQASNGSKPYQAQLIRAAGFDVPETLITNDPDAVLDFRSCHGRLVYKSMSAERSVVKVLTDLAMQRLDRIRWCPVQFQEYIDGVDVRVHTVGDVVTHAVAVHANGAVDYRYPGESGAAFPVIEPYRLDADLAARCHRLSGSLGLVLAGIDLRIRSDGSAVCFEVNPSPAYSYYELGAGVPIADSLARVLAEGRG